MDDIVNLMFLIMNNPLVDDAVRTRAAFLYQMLGRINYHGRQARQ